MTDDAHRRSAALLYEKMPSAVTKDERHVGKIFNVMAAHGKLGETQTIAELSGIAESAVQQLVILYRKCVLGVELRGDQ